MLRWGEELSPSPTLLRWDSRTHITAASAGAKGESTLTLQVWGLTLSSSLGYFKIPQSFFLMLCSNRRSLYAWFDWLCFEKIEWPTWLSSFDTSERNNYTRQSEEASVWFHSTLEWFGCSETPTHPPARRVFCLATDTKGKKKTEKKQ